MRTERPLLLAGIAVPLLYFGNLILSSLFYPGYSHATQYASELGSPAARFPWLFNTGVVLTGLASVAAGFGLYFALRRLTGRTVLPFLFALTLVLFGLAIVMGGFFPMPDPRHGAYGLGMAVNLSPILLAAALWRHRSLRWLTIYLLVTAVLLIVFFAIMMGVGGLVTRANVGIFQRLYSLCTFPWIGIASYGLGRELGLMGSPAAGA